MSGGTDKRPGDRDPLGLTAAHMREMADLTVEPLVELLADPEAAPRRAGRRGRR